MSQPDDAPIELEAGLAALVRRAQAGDRDAFGELYGRHVRMVHGIVLAHGAADDPADVVHDVFVTALDRLRTLRDPAAFGSWLAAIARNAARMSRRRRIRLVSLPESLPAPAREAPELDGATVLAAIRSLPEAYRETLVLRLVEGMGGQEIALRTGLTPGSVRVNLHRGMALLREKLERLR